VTCAECRGACCEELEFATVPEDFFAAEWLAVRGTVLERRRGEVPGKPIALLRFECRCPELTSDGRCAVYADRPLNCVLYQEGGPACLEVVARRRAPP
jgi:Fe-S-cluster containining protein